MVSQETELCESKSVDGPLWACRGMLIVVALMVAVAICTWDGWWAGGVRESKARGDRIVKALLRHKQDHGTFPDSLAALVPEYLDAIADPVIGDRTWKYNGTYQGGWSSSLRFGGKGLEPGFWHELGKYGEWHKTERVMLWPRW